MRPGVILELLHPYSLLDTRIHPLVVSLAHAAMPRTMRAVVSEGMLLVDVTQSRLRRTREI